MQADVVFCPILRKLRFFQHHAIPGPSWIDPMTMIFYSPVEKSYISLLSKKNDETIPLSLKKSCMICCIHNLHPGGQTSGVFFKGSPVVPVSNTLENDVFCHLSKIVSNQLLFTFVEYPLGTVCLSRPFSLHFSAAYLR